jgi:hypothetical protein
MYGYAQAGGAIMATAIIAQAAPQGRQEMQGKSAESLFFSLLAPWQFKFWRVLKGIKMERKTRFELATFSLARRCSTTEPLPLAT